MLPNFYSVISGAGMVGLYSGVGSGLGSSAGLGLAGPSNGTTASVHVTVENTDNAVTVSSNESSIVIVKDQ
jgi:hypothetical protein